MSSPRSRVKRIENNVSTSIAPNNVAPTSGLRSMESKHHSLTVLRCKLVIVGTFMILSSTFVSDYN